MNPFVISLAIRLTVLLLAGALVTLAVKRSTYAVRYVVIAATIVSVIALPAMMLLVPEWRVGVLPAHTRPVDVIIPAPPPRAAAPHVAPRPVAPATPIAHESTHPVLVTSQLESPPSAAPGTVDAPTPLARPPFAPTISQIALAIWLLGVVIGMAWIAAGRIGLARVIRGATRLTTMEWRTILATEALHAGVAREVALLTSPAVSMPVTWGVLSPVIVLPEASLAWTHERKRVVVMHEMAHIARRDSATQFLATFACVAYWLHPLVLLAARRLRAECERACDERVLERGMPPVDYAAHLLDVARFSRSFGAASIVSVAMARPSQLEGRLLAVLRAKPRHSQLSRVPRVLALVSAVSMLMAISAFRPVVRDAHATKAHFALRVSVVAPGAPAPNSAAAGYAAATASGRPDTLAIRPSANLLSTRRHPDSTFEKSVTVHEGGTLVLDLDTGGDVKISGSDESTVSVSGSLSGRDWRSATVSLDASNGDARLESRVDRASPHQEFHNAFSIRVPKRYNIRVTSAGGGVSISGLVGTFTGHTGGGKIEIDHAKGDADLSTGGGEVRLTSSQLDGNVSTGGGNVSFENVTGSVVSGPAGSGVRTFGSRLAAPDEFEILSSSGGDTISLKRMRITMTRAREAMKRAQRGVERSNSIRQRIRIRMDGDSANGDSWSEPDSELDFHGEELSPQMEELSRQREMLSREKMEHLGEQLDRNRVFMDSARVMIDRDRGTMDSARTMMRRKMLPLELEFEPLPGNLSLGDSKNPIVIATDGGAVHLLKAPNGAHVTTGGGEIVIGSSAGTVSALTGAGRISIGRADGAARATTGAGDVTITAGSGEAHPVDIRSGSGNVDLMLPKGTNATLDLETAYTQNYGKHTKIKSDWPLAVTETEEWDSSQGSPRKFVRARQKIGNGGPLIRVRTVNGDIKLKEAN